MSFPLTSSERGPYDPADGLNPVLHVILCAGHEQVRLMIGRHPLSITPCRDGTKTPPVNALILYNYSLTGDRSVQAVQESATKHRTIVYQKVILSDLFSQLRTSLHCDRLIARKIVLWPESGVVDKVKHLERNNRVNTSDDNNHCLERVCEYEASRART